MKYKYLKLVAFPFIALIFLSVLPFMNAQTDTSAISLSGENWALKVDSTLQTATDSKSVPYVSTTTKGEKELFLTLNSLEDCKLGYIQFKVQTSGLTVYKQLPLNEEIELKEGEIDFVNATHAMLGKEVKVYRPGNVVNSFACFDENGKKVLHIYASKLIDNAGNSVWVDSDLKDGLLTVLLDNEFLETAKFPVTLDPTFGYTSVGGSDIAINYGEIVCKYSLSVNASVSKISAYLHSNMATNTSAVIYSDNSGVPDALLGTSQVTQIDTSFAWFNYSFTENITLETGTYHIGILSDGWTQWNYDSGDTAQTHFFEVDIYPNPRDPFGTSTARTDKISIYATYEEYIEPTPTPTPTPEPTATPTPTPTPTPTEFTSTETWNIIILLVMLIVGLILALKRTLPILNFVFGMFAIAISAWTLTVAPYFGGLLQLAVIIIGIIVMVSGYKEVY